MLVPLNANKAMYNVLAGDGASKGNDRWKTMKRWVYCWKAIKHILMYMAGVAKDKDSKKHTLGHAMARCALVIEKDKLDEGPAEPYHYDRPLWPEGFNN